MLWERFPQGRRLVVGRHPDISPAEFFAISLELYFSPGGRKKIQARDPALLEFLDFFLLPDSK
jgi:Mlc titration factor MtfA (ptsG expression regulator)